MSTKSFRIFQPVAIVVNKFSIKSQLLFTQTTGSGFRTGANNLLLGSEKL